MCWFRCVIRQSFFAVETIKYLKGLPYSCTDSEVLPSQCYLLWCWLKSWFGWVHFSIHSTHCFFGLARYLNWHWVFKVLQVREYCLELTRWPILAEQWVESWRCLSLFIKHQYFYSTNHFVALKHSFLESTNSVTWRSERFDLQVKLQDLSIFASRRVFLFPKGYTSDWYWCNLMWFFLFHRDNDCFSR